MDPFPATWSSSYPELEDTAFMDPWQMKSSSIDDQPATNYPSFSNIPHDLTASESSINTATTLTFSNPHSSQQGNLIFRKKPPSSSSISSSTHPPISTSKFISFGNSNSNSKKYLSPYQQDGTAKNFTIKTEPEMNPMIWFDFSSTTSTTTSSSSLQELHLQGHDHQPAVRTTRTPLQAKYHVIAERKRREKLSQKFMALSALVPGLKKLDKTSVIEGAINHLKRLEERLKALEELGSTTKMKDQDIEDQSVVLLSTAEKPCLCYHYEEDSPPLNTMEVRILKGDVLIKVNCKNQTGFRWEEEFVSEMKKLDLSVTKAKFMPFGDNMIAVSAVGQMNEGFCMTEEELANSIRLAILKLINMKKLNTCL